MSHRWSVLALSAITSLLTLGLVKCFLPWLELRGHDTLFVWRYRLHGPLPLDPRIHLIGVDEASVRALAKPAVLWPADFALAISRLKAAGAVVVGVDFIFNSDTSGLADSNPVRAAIESSQDQLAETVLKGGVVLTELLAPDGRTELGPNEVLLAAASAAPDGNSLAAANVLTDTDGVIRSIPLLSYPDGSPRTLASLLALRAGVRPAPGQALLVNYPGPAPAQLGASLIATSFPFTPLNEVLAADLASSLKGSLCLLVPAAASFQDLRATPYNLMADRDAWGGEVHAAALNTMLKGDYLRRAGGAGTSGATLAFGLIAGMLGLALRPRNGVLAFFLLGGAYALLVLQLFSHGYVLPLFTPPLAGLLAFLIGYIVRYRAEEGERRKVESTLGRMVSTPVMREMMRRSGGLSFAATRRRITVLFSDINDFTPMCERHTPEEVIQMLNLYFTEMTAIVDRHGGAVKQFVGDEIMVMFGAPEDQPDHAARAVATALDMLERLREMAAADPTGEGFYDVKIGINTGDVVVGTVGSASRFEYAAVGDDVNLGARIESLTKKVGAALLVSEETRREAEPRMPDAQFRSLGVQQFKGKQAQVEVYEVTRKVRI